MTQPMEPQAFTDFCDTLIAALPNPIVIRTLRTLIADWTSPTNIAWRIRVWTTTDLVGGQEVHITSPHSTTELARVHHASDLLAMLKTLKAIAETPTPTDVEPSPVGVTSSAVDLTRELSPAGLVETPAGAVRRAAGELERLRIGLEERDWFAIDGLPVDEAYVTLALSIADGLGQEQARVQSMAYQRGRILELCRAASELPLHTPIPRTVWTLDPAAVVAALGDDDVWPWHGVADPWAKPLDAAAVAEQALEFASQLVSFANHLNGTTTTAEVGPARPMSADEELLHAVAWEGQRLIGESEHELGSGERGAHQLVVLACEADVSSRLAQGVLAMLKEDLGEEDRSALIADWRAANSPAAVVPDEGCCTAGVVASPDPCPWHTEEPETAIPYAPEEVDERG